MRGCPVQAGFAWVGISVVRTKIPTLAKRGLGWGTRLMGQPRMELLNGAAGRLSFRRLELSGRIVSQKPKRFEPAARRELSSTKHDCQPSEARVEPRMLNLTLMQ